MTHQPTCKTVLAMLAQRSSGTPHVRRARRRWGGRLAVAALVASVLVAGTAAAAQASEFTGTCLASPTLPCSAAAGQTYTNLTMGKDTAGGSDSEAAVEAVLAHVVGPPVDVAPLATDLTAHTDLGDFDLTLDQLTSGTGLDWSYRGPAQNLAYLTVKAGNGFAVFGIAGRTSGSVNLADLTGGHGVSHVGFWTTSISKAAPVLAKRLHGKGFFGNSRLGKIENGKVPCVDATTAKPARCAFTKRARSTGLLGGLLCPLLDTLGIVRCPPAKSGSWLESPNGDYALTGQGISLQGKPGGGYVIAAKISPNGTVPVLEPSGRDSAGTPVGSELAGACTIETIGSRSNANPALRLENYATLQVPTSDHPHPDGAARTSSTPDGVFRYTGRGAGLNDRNGTERDEFDRYLPRSSACHRGWNAASSTEFPAAKRPLNTAYYPQRVLPKTPIAWRAVHPTLAIANEN